MSELVVDNFAGGGGASTGIEMAIGRSVDIAINHDPDAIAMHKVNHPTTRHYCEDVFDVNPLEATQGTPVALAWFSPDCKHFSKAKGGTPVSKKIRGLAWVAIKWAKAVKPRVIILENVEEFKTWGPLKDTEKGLYPDPEHKGETFNDFINQLEACGYVVDYKELRACDYGAPTTRKRFFLIARSDGQPIIWPEATHGHRDTLEVLSRIKQPYHSAAECIDWDLPGNSIFNRKKPLAKNTMDRIARGLKKFVFDAPKPFIVRIGQTGFGGDRLSYSIEQPLTTITTKAEHCLVTPTIMVNNTGHTGSAVTDPLKTITTGGNQMLVQASWRKEDSTQSTGTAIGGPLGTVTAQSVHQGSNTTYNPKAQFVAYDLRAKDSVPKDIFNAQFYSILDTIWSDAIKHGIPEKEAYIKGEKDLGDIERYIVIMDEVQEYLNPNMDYAITFINNFIKELAKFFAGAILITPSPQHFFPEEATNSSSEMKQIFNGCTNKFFFKANTGDVDVYRNQFSNILSPTQLEAMVDFEVGDAYMVIADSKAMRIHTHYDENRAEFYAGGV